MNITQTTKLCALLSRATPASHKVRLWNLGVAAGSRGTLDYSWKLSPGMPQERHYGLQLAPYVRPFALQHVSKLPGL